MYQNHNLEQKSSLNVAYRRLRKILERGKVLQPFVPKTVHVEIPLLYTAGLRDTEE